MGKITIADVAEHAGVSKSTVSQYLNKRFDYMGEKTKQRIEDSIKELKYSPNIIARSLKQKSTKTIGVIVANILYVFSTQVIRAIEDFCNEQDFHVIVCNADDNPDKEKRYIEMLQAKQVDGIIVFPTGGNVELYQNLRESNYPLVFMDRFIPNLDVDTVMLDNQKAPLLAVEEFVNKGYDRIGILSPPLSENLIPRLERFKAFKKALQNYNLTFYSEYVMHEKIESIPQLMEKMMNQSKPPNALLAMNDRVLYQILTYIKEEQLVIPDDLAVIGIDDVAIATLYSPTITTIAQPAFEMGKQAAELLLNQITHKDSHIQPNVYRFEPELIVRNSC